MAMVWYRILVSCCHTHLFYVPCVGTSLYLTSDISHIKLEHCIISASLLLDGDYEF